MQSSEKITYYDVVISGMGSGGLATAWEAIKQNKKVLIISDRPADFVRVQWIAVQLKEYLYRMIEEGEKLDEMDLTFLSILSNLTDAQLAIKDVERFIMNRLKYLKEQGGNIDFVFESQLVELNLNKGIAKIAPKTDDKKEKNVGPSAVQFKYLIGADGVKHHAYDLVKENKSVNIIYNKKPGCGHSMHVSAYVTVERTDGAPLGLAQGGFVVYENLICNIKSNTHSLVKSNMKQVKCHFTSELPAHIYEMKDAEEKKEAAFKFIQTAMEKFFAASNEGHSVQIDLVKKSKKHGLSKDKTKFMIFNSEIYQASQAAVEVDGHFFILLGSAFRSPAHQTASGMQMTLMQAIMAGQIFSNKKTISDYNQFAEEQAKLIDSQIQNFSKRREELINDAKNSSVFTDTTKFKWVR